jgi:transcriptional regulator with PAS, ATPase and Fis domain
VEDFVGHPVGEVVQNTQMDRVIRTGKPILIDLLSNKAGTFVVSRIPLRDDAGQVIGALGIVLFDHPETTLQPLIQKFAHLQRDLDDARRELASQRRTKYTLASFIGSSPPAVEVKRQARRAAASSSPVLLLGETGTGKELLAHAIHAASARAAGPLVSVNIAAVPDTLLEAEFFGVAPGAYTGADRKGRDGKFKLADGGTLFLDEIGDMPLPLQAKLLRALQEGEIEPLGSNKVVPFDARVIAATSRDLARWCATAASARTCTTASTCCRSGCRRCASGAPTSRRCWRCWARTWRCATARRPRSSARTPRRCSPPRPGAATSASCATSWSRRPCAATRPASMYERMTNPVR